VGEQQLGVVSLSPLIAASVAHMPGTRERPLLSTQKAASRTATARTGALYPRFRNMQCTKAGCEGRSISLGVGFRNEDFVGRDDRVKRIDETGVARPFCSITQ
jgi:hypothetical protein